MAVIPSWKKRMVMSAILAMMGKLTRSQNAGYVPQLGAETICLNFALDLYNKYCSRAARVGPLSIAQVSVQPVRSGMSFQSDVYYRFFGTILMDTVCPKTAATNGASARACPVISPNPTMGGQPWMKTCNFKVFYSSALSGEGRLKMVYMMCYRDT